jgi:hypothetical protein
LTISPFTKLVAEYLCIVSRINRKSPVKEECVYLTRKRVLRCNRSQLADELIMLLRSVRPILWKRLNNDSWLSVASNTNQG